MTRGYRIYNTYPTEAESARAARLLWLRGRNLFRMARICEGDRKPLKVDGVYSFVGADPDTPDPNPDSDPKHYGLSQVQSCLSPDGDGMRYLRQWAALSLTTGEITIGKELVRDASSRPLARGSDFIRTVAIVNPTYGSARGWSEYYGPDGRRYEPIRETLHTDDARTEANGVLEHFETMLNQHLGIEPTAQ